jgi:phosphatidylglycerol:prolipoprotein diacylglycerol transferase
MHPELFEIPFLHISVKSYGTMMVIGFLMACLLMRAMMRRVGQEPDYVSNVAMYALLCGVVGARVFFVLHYSEQFKGRPLDVFAVWNGGLELLGGVITAIAFLMVYLWKQKLPKRLYLDVLAVGLMVGVGFGRIGCLMNGCCYGKTCDAPWAIRFPYGSPVYYSQVQPDPARNRTEPLLELPQDYFNNGYLKPYEDLKEAQKEAVKDGPYHALKVHPTQIYSSIDAFLLAGILYAVWRCIGQRKPGVVSALMLILYGTARFLIERLRDDNPFETAWWAIYKGGTVSQNISIYMVIVGAILLAIMATRKPVKQDEAQAQRHK